LKTKKNILITIDWFLPGTDSGGPARSYANLMGHLAQDFNFYVITRDTDYCATTPYTNITSNAWNSMEELANVYYCSDAALNTKSLIRLFRSKTFDVIYINGMYSWYFSILPLLVFKEHPKVIVAARGMLNPQAFSVKPIKKRLYVGLAKYLGLFKKMSFQATNVIERNHIFSLIGPESDVKVAPNLPRVLRASFNEKDKREVTQFVNVARISKEKGTLKMLTAFQAIRSPVVLDMYGPVYDSLYWEACKEVISALPINIKVSYKGIAKSEDIPELLKSYDFFIMLSEGENFGHAILEAFSAGLPVIISNKTPWTGLKEKNIGWDIDTNNLENTHLILKQIIAMSNPAYKEMAELAYQHAKSFTENETLIEQNRNLFCDSGT
jgi:glycosyltransferase involved in cell wall biosynthesis